MRMYKLIKAESPNAKPYRHHIGGGIYCYIELNQYKTFNVRLMKKDAGKLVPDLSRGFYLRQGDFKEFYSKLYFLVSEDQLEISDLETCEETHNSAKEYSQCGYCNPHRLHIESDEDSSDTE